MVEVLRSILPADLVEHIANLIPQDQEVEWEMVYGATTIYRTKHYITYGGGPEGGLVYFFRERRAGWYRWRRNWGEEPVYTMIEEGKVVWKWSGDVEYIAVVPEDYEPDENENEDIMIMDDGFMQEQEG
jgi:hypothetical protein